jgi:hypothetical protein
MFGKMGQGARPGVNTQCSHARIVAALLTRRRHYTM